MCCLLCCSASCLQGVCCPTCMTACYCSGECLALDEKKHAAMCKQLAAAKRVRHQSPATYPQLCVICQILWQCTCTHIPDTLCNLTVVCSLHWQHLLIIYTLLQMTPPRIAPFLHVLQRQVVACGCGASGCTACKPRSEGPARRLLQLLQAADAEPWPWGLDFGLAALESLDASKSGSMLPGGLLLQEAT
jgi:hypothetical protein